MSPEAKLDAILASLSGIMGRMDAQDAALAEIAQAIAIADLMEFAEMPCEGSA